MSRTNFDRKIIEMTCPNCGKKLKKTIGWFKMGNQVCPFECGTVYKRDTFTARLKKIETSLAKLTKSFDKKTKIVK